MSSKIKVFKSNSVGDITAFENGFKEFPYSVSLHIDDGFNFDDRSDYKVWMQIEPPEVINYIHATEFPQIKQTTKEQLLENKFFYDLILAWDEEILAACPNAVCFPAALCTWIDPCYVPFVNAPPKEKDSDAQDYDCHNDNKCTRVPEGLCKTGGTVRPKER